MLLILGFFVIAIFLIVRSVLSIKARGSGLRDARVASRRAAISCGCAALPIVIGAIVIGGSTLYDSLRPPSEAFEQVFGVAPGPAIKGLEAQSSAGWDFAIVYLAFERSDAAWRQVVGTGPFRTVDPSSARLDSLASDAPEWWRAAPDTPDHRCRDGHALETESHGRWEYVTVVDCPEHGRIYVLASSID